MDQTCNNYNIVLHESVKYYNSFLSQSEEAKDYLHQRGFSDETMNKFQLGYASGGLKEHLFSKGISEDEAIEAGVLVKNQDTGEAHDHFFNRIIIPNILDGQVVFITGRSVGNQLPRYLSFKKKMELLYNEGILRDSNLKKVFLAEGPFGAIAGVQAGFPCVGQYGINSFSAEVIKSKTRNVKEVFIVFDNDGAGNLAALRLGITLDNKAKIICLPENQDFDQFLKNHPKEDFDNLVDHAKTPKDFMVDLLVREDASTSLSLRIRPVLTILATVDKLQAEEYLKHMQKELDLHTNEMQAIRSQLSQIRKYNRAHKEKGKESFKQKIYEANFLGLVDLAITQEGEVCFLILEDEELIIKKSYVYKDQILIPPPLDKIPFQLARAEEVIKIYNERKSLGHEFANTMDWELYHDLTLHFSTAADLPHQFHAPLLSLFTILSYFLVTGQFQFSPYLCFSGPLEHGKSRIGKAILYCCYRPILIESVREAHIIRLADYFNCTIFFDCRDLWKKATQASSADIFLHRSNKGGKAIRVLNPDLGRFLDTTFFKIFGATLIATNYLPDEILNSRSIQINMQRSDKIFEEDITEELCLPLRERLLAMRADYLFTEFPKVHRPAKGRLGEIMTPLSQIINFFFSDGQIQEAFEKYVHDLETEIEENRTETAEVTVLKKLFVLRNSVEAGLLPIEVITREFNSGKPSQYTRSNKSIGWILKNLNFNKHTLSDGTKAIQFDLKLLKAHMIVHGLEYLIRQAEQRDRDSQGNVPPENS